MAAHDEDRRTPSPDLPVPPEVKERARQQRRREVTHPAEVEAVEAEFREQPDLNRRRDPLPGRPDFPEGPA